jgi:glycosyltransferase involved in cell wall biosynthesis
MGERQKESMGPFVVTGGDNQPVVEVLLATYNGARFLREQIDSILTQDYARLRILARDDGSTDETANVLNEYAERFPERFRVMPLSPATGSAKDNFLRLMQESSANYVCFSDQDDVWLTNKISQTMRAMKQLETQWGQDTPLLVFTDLRVVDQQLNLLHDSFWAHERIKPDRIDRMTSILQRNVVTGCTAMLNRRLLDIALRMPKEAAMHDHWVALLASAIGRSSAVESPTILYRQHGQNVVGVKKSRSLPEVVRRIFRNDARIVQWNIHQQQARALLAIHHDELSTKDRNLLEAYLRCGTSNSRIIRIATLMRYGFYRTTAMENIATLVDLWRMKVSSAG